MIPIEYYTKVTDFDTAHEQMIVEQVDWPHLIGFFAWTLNTWENERKGSSDSDYRTAYFRVKPRLTPAI